MGSRMEKRTGKGVTLLVFLWFAIAILQFEGVGAEAADAHKGMKSAGSGTGSETSKVPADGNLEAQKSGGSGGGIFGQLGKDVTRKVARDTIAKWIQENIPHPVLLALVLVGLAVVAAYYIWKFCQNRRQSETGSSEEAEGLTSVVAADGDANRVPDPPIQAQCDHSVTLVIQTPDNETDNGAQNTPTRAA